jgi:uncharacterized protein
MKRIIFAGLLGALCIAGAPVFSAGPGPALDLPALTTQASHEHHYGKVIWTDLVTPNVDAAKKFYGGLFGWSFRDVPGDPNYTLAMLDDEPVAGIYRKDYPVGEQRQPAWLAFLAVRDADAAGQLARAHGGKVLSTPRNFGHRGRQAVLSDPDGAVFGVLAAQGGDPSDYLAAPGEWIWSSVLVKDAQRETAFYRTLFGYDVHDLALEGGDEADQDRGQHFVLARDNYARAGLNVLPSDEHRRYPHWMNFVRVTDASVAAQKAAALGGRVLVEPRADRHGGQLAILADPSGAVFGVMEWSDTDTKQEPP